MRLPTRALVALAALAAAAGPGAALAQVPPHTPGTICFTPDFWCWAPVPGIPGEPCECPGGMPGVFG